MFSNYTYQILFNDYNEINHLDYSIYSKSIDDAYDYIETHYSHIIKKEKWVIERAYNFDSHDSINVLSSRFYNIDCEIKLIVSDKIDRLVEFYKDIKFDKKENYKEIVIKSVYIVEIPGTNLIKVFEFENNFRKYQNKYLNLLGYIKVENSQGLIQEIPDSDYLAHIPVDKKIIWFLQNHFREKTLDNSVVLSGLENITNFILDKDNLGFDSDSEIILVLYNVFFI